MNNIWSLDIHLNYFNNFIIISSQNYEYGSMEQYIFRIIIQSQEQITNPRFNIGVKPINYQLKLLNYRRELILLLRELKQIVEDIQKFATSFDQFSFTHAITHGRWPFRGLNRHQLIRFGIIYKLPSSASNPFNFDNLNLIWLPSGLLLVSR